VKIGSLPDRGHRLVGCAAVDYTETNHFAPPAARLKTAANGKNPFSHHFGANHPTGWL